MFRHPSIPWVSTAVAFVLGAHYASVLAQESGRDAAQRPSYYYGHYDPDTVARAPKPVKKPAAAPAPVPRIVPLPPSSPPPAGRKPFFPNQDASPSRKPAKVSPDEQGPTALRRPALITQPAAIKPLGAKDSAPLFPVPEAIKAETIAAQPAAPPDPKPAKAGSPRSMFVTTAPAQDRTAAPTNAGPSPGLSALPKLNHAQPAQTQPIPAPAFSTLFSKSMFSKYLPSESQRPAPTAVTHSSSTNTQSRLVDAQPADANSVSPPSANEPQPLVPKRMFVDAGVAESQPATPPMAGRFPSPRALPKVVKSESADAGNAASIVSQQPRGLVVLPRIAKATPGEDKIAALHPLSHWPATRVVPEVAPHPAAPATSQGIEPAENSVRALAPGSEPMIVVVESTKQRSPGSVGTQAKHPPTTTAALGEAVLSEKALPESSAPKTVANTAPPKRQPEVAAAPIKNTVPGTIGAPMQQSAASDIPPAKKASPTNVGFVFPKLLKVADSAAAERTARVAAVTPAKKQTKVVKTSAKKLKSNTIPAPIEPAKVADAKSSKSQASPAAEMPVEPSPTIAATEKDELKLPLRPNPVRSRQTYLVSKYAASIATAPAETPRQPTESASPLASAPLKSEKPLRANPVREMDRLSDAGHANPLR
jgi:hypothetical protein